MNKLNSKAPEEGTLGAITKYFSIASIILSLIFAPFVLAKRLLSDERRLSKLNRKFIPPTQYQKSDSFRQKLIFIMLALTLIQIGLVICIFTGYGVEGYGNPQRAIERLVFSLKVPELNEIIDIKLLISFLFLSLTGFLFKYILFLRPGSHYALMFESLKINNLDSGTPRHQIWYYPGKVLYLPLTGSVGDDIVRRTALWAYADFHPTLDLVNMPGENSYLFIAAPKKHTNSTMIYDQYEVWTNQIIGDKLKSYHWFLGEYVNRADYKWKDSFKDFSIAFIGQSGSGKTEAMKNWLSAFFCKHPNTVLGLADLKKTADWDVFGPLTENGYVVKTEAEALLLISYFDDLMEQRTQYMAEKGYKNLKAWSEAEGIDVPPCLLVIDEFPQMGGSLKYDMHSRRDGTPANVLFKLMSKGRSFGLWVIIGSQRSNYEAIPSDMNANIKVHVVLRTGTETESVHWIGSGAAFRLGKGKKKPDGSDDYQEGYAYIDCEEDFVRFWYMDDWFIAHEFLKYGVSPIEGQKLFEPRVPAVPADIAKKIEGLEKIGKSEKDLSQYDKDFLKNHRAAVERFKKSYEQLLKNPHPNLSKNKAPLGYLWEKDESVEDYVIRFRTARGVALPNGATPRPTNMPTMQMGKPDSQKKPTGKFSFKLTNLPPEEDESDREYNKMLEEARKKRQAILAKSGSKEKKTKSSAKRNNEIKKKPNNKSEK